MVQKSQGVRAEKICHFYHDERVIGLDDTLSVAAKDTVDGVPRQSTVVVSANGETINSIVDCLQCWHVS
jgi:hypothetical protein